MKCALCGFEFEEDNNTCQGCLFSKNCKIKELRTKIRTINRKLSEKKKEKRGGKNLDSAFDNTRTLFLVLFTGNPEALEGLERGEDRSTNPDGVTAFRGGDNTNFHVFRDEFSEFFV